MPGLYWMFHVSALNEICEGADGDIEGLLAAPIASAVAGRKRWIIFMTRV